MRHRGFESNEVTQHVLFTVFMIAVCFSSFLLSFVVYLRNDSFTFKAHREKQNVYAVNCIHFHPYGTFATCGSDGSFHVCVFTITFLPISDIICKKSFSFQGLLLDLSLSLPSLSPPLLLFVPH